MTRQVSLLGVTFAALSLAEAADALVAAASESPPARFRHMVTANVAVVMMARRDPMLASVLDDAEWCVSDGQPLVWLSRALGTPLPGRVTGVDLVDDVCARAASAGLGVHLLGASLTTVSSVADLLRQRHRGLDVTVSDGYFTLDEAPARAAAVAATGARLLIVGMGVPRQERFLVDHGPATGVAAAVGVGGSFEVLAGNLKRAPRAWQDAGLEWLYRLLQEPRRLLKRYAVTNTAFVALAGREIVVHHAARLRRRPERQV